MMVKSIIIKHKSTDGFLRDDLFGKDEFYHVDSIDKIIEDPNEHLPSRLNA